MSPERRSKSFQKRGWGDYEIIPRRKQRTSLSIEFENLTTGAQVVNCYGSVLSVLSLFEQACPLES